MLFLVDKSAHEVARRDHAARRQFETLAVTGLLATCAMVELEILFSARNVAEHSTLRRYLHEQCVWLETTDETLSEAIDIQAQMLAAGMGRKPLPDLIIAAVGRAYDAVVLHHDRDFDDIAKVVEGVTSRWIARPRKSKAR